MHKKLNFTNNKSMRDSVIGSRAFYKSKYFNKTLQDSKRQSPYHAQNNNNKNKEKK